MARQGSAKAPTAVRIRSEPHFSSLMNLTPVSRDFFTRPDVITIAQELIGKILLTYIDGIRCSGIITETEAYRHYGDKACHAHLNKKTRSNSPMFELGGTTYVYLCYGIHHLFNISCNQEGLADAVLIRSIAALEGTDTMLKRRNKQNIQKNLTAGPGNLTQALGINRNHNQLILNRENIHILEDLQKPLPKIRSSARVGINYAEEDADLPWRFLHTDSRYISKN